MPDPRPLTALEEAIRAAQAGRSEPADALQVLAGSAVLVPSVTEVQTSMEEMTPLLFDKEGVTMLAVFTHEDQIAEFASHARYVLQLRAAELVQRMPPGSGIVINPRREIGMEVPPFAIEILAAAIGRSSAHSTDWNDNG